MLRGIIVYREEHCGYFNPICKFVAKPNEEEETYDIIGTVSKKNGLSWNATAFICKYVSYKDFKMKVNKDNPVYSRVIRDCSRLEAEKFIFKIKDIVDKRQRFYYKLMR